MAKITSAPYTTESALDFYDFVKNNPGVKLTKEALAWVKEHEADMQGLFNDFSLSVIENGLKSSGDDIALQVGMLFGSVYKDAPYGSWMSGVNQSLTAGVTSTVSSGFKSISNTLGSAFKGSVVGTFIGTGFGMASGDSFGQAFASSAVTSAISAGITFALVSNPVGWAAIGVATVVSIGTTVLYNFNVGGIKDVTESLGSKIDDGIDWGKQKLKEVGNVMDDTWDSIKNWSW